MRRFGVRVGVALAALALSLGAAACAADEPSSPTTVEETPAEVPADSGGIVYVLPDELPDDWVVKIATERPGDIAEKPDAPADYGVSWTPEELAGKNRKEAIEMPDEGELLFINVGSAFYAQQYGADLPTDPATAPIQTMEGVHHIEFLMDGSIVRVSGRDVEEDTVRAVATSLRIYGQEEWRAALGDRLLVDPAPQG